MIYTVTVNPAIDYYVEVEDFQELELNSCQEGYSLMGGKGINVSKVLDNFKVPSLALGFVGGYTGDYILSSFEKAGMAEAFSSLEEDTRINIKLKSKKGETEIAGKAPKISEKAKEDFFRKLENLVEGDILVLSGSVPKSLGDGFYADILETLPKGVRVVLDSRGPVFKKALEKGVWLTKPNREELEAFVGRSLDTTAKLIAAGKEVQAQGSENVVISMGKEGSICISQEGVFLGTAPKGELISSVGAGDSMVAGILYAMETGKTLEEAYAYGIAAGSSTAFSKGLTTLEDMKYWKEKLEITKEETC